MDLLQGIASAADQQTMSPSAPADQPSQESPAQKVVQQPHGIPATLLILDTETTGLDPDQDHCTAEFYHAIADSAKEFFKVELLGAY